MYAITCRGMFVTTPENYATDRRSAMLFDTVVTALPIARRFAADAPGQVKIIEVETRVICGKSKQTIMEL